MATGLRGDVWCGWGGEHLVSWPVGGYSGWDILALETVRLLQTSQLGMALPLSLSLCPNMVVCRCVRGGAGEEGD